MDISLTSYTYEIAITTVEYKQQSTNLSLCRADVPRVGLLLPMDSNQYNQRQYHVYYTAHAVISVR